MSDVLPSLALAFISIGVTAPEGRAVHPGGDCGLGAEVDVQPHEPVIDCTQSADVGYVDGVPFEITVVHIDGKPVERDTADAYGVMREAAAADGVDLHVISGFRTMAEQEYLYMCYRCDCCNSGNVAAPPGYSNHQSGHALDLNTSAAGVYAWLAAHGAQYGFEETVPSEDWHWEWWGGGPGGGICDVATPPQGAVDAATCEEIHGWAQDLDVAEQSIFVDIVFDGALGDPQATSVRVLADLVRDDLCEALGSCAHGFSLPFPRGFADGRDHSVRAFAIDDAGAENAELAISVASVNCLPPELPDGVRRRVPDAAAFERWRFSALWDVAHVDEATLVGVPEGVELGAAPVLLRTVTAPELWLVDQGRRRLVAPDAVAKWRFDPSTATIVDEDELVELGQGSALEGPPFLVRGSTEGIWLIDDPQADDGADGHGSSDDGSSGGGSSDDAMSEGGMLDADDAQSDGACRCTAPSGGGSPVGFAWILPLLGARRRAR